MFRSTKNLIWLSAGSAALAGLFYWWWTRLIVGTFAECVGGNPAAGVDCAHSAQMYAAIVFAAITVALLLATAIRALRPGIERAA